MAAQIEPLEPSSEPRWLVTKNQRGSVVESQPIPAGANLKREFLRAMLQWIEADWDVADFNSRTGQFRCTKGTDARTVFVSGEPPGPRGR